MKTADFEDASAMVNGFLQRERLKQKIFK